MPFVVITKRPDGDDGNCDCLVPYMEGAGQHSPGCACFTPRSVSRVAVATLEEAHDLVVGEWQRFPKRPTPIYEAVRSLISESGGTVGPLPDGTLIEVESRQWYQLAEAVGWHPDRDEHRSEAEVIAAFNAREVADAA